MRAPYELQLQSKNSQRFCQDSTPSAGRTHKCQNLECDNEFQHRPRGGNKFCCAKCLQGMTQNARSATRHLKRYLRSSLHREFVSDLAFSGQELMISLDNCLESLPSSPDTRFESFWKELEKLDLLMVTKGPVGAGIRAAIRTRAAVLAAALDLEEPSTRRLKDCRCLAVRARELLRDTPVEGPLTAPALLILLGHAKAAVQFFLEIRDFPNLGRALIALGNIYRVAGRKREGTQKYLWALHILNEGCDPGDPTVARLLHEARCWRLRLEGQNIEQPVIRSEIAKLTRLANQVNHPCMWVAHYREEAGFASYLLCDPDLATQRMHDLELARRQLTNYTAFADTTLVTPLIEFLFENHKDEEAIEVIQKRYVPLYLRHRSQYCYRRILRWRRDHMFEVVVPPPEYAGALISYLPRYQGNSCESDGV